MNPLFHANEVTEEQHSRITEIQDAFEKLFVEITKKAPASRFRAKALTSLVEACLLVGKSIEIEGRDADRY